MIKLSNPFHKISSSAKALSKLQKRTAASLSKFLILHITKTKTLINLVNC